ncbi:MAG: ABC transporter ATP-binding protein [Candidatus Heimdallarchaeaceae archaeon]
MNISLKNISKQYNSKTVLKNINLDIKSGSFVVILGPSGSGKTTLLRIIAGLAFPTTGDILFDNQNVTLLPANKRNVAMVFQNYPLFPHMTVEQNLRFAIESKTVGKLFKKSLYTKEEIDKRVKEILKLLDLEDHASKYPHQLSGGEQQRVAIGRELIRNPVVFLFDEPLSNIDARLRYKMRTWIRNLHKILQTTMIYVTHDQAEAMSLGNVIILLKDGEIIQIGTPEELYHNPSCKFAAEFIGYFPMNFLPFKKIKDAFVLDLEKRIPITEIMHKIMDTPRILDGTIGFRAEDIEEHKTFHSSEMFLKLECDIKDIERALDKQIVSLDFYSYQIIYIVDINRKLKSNQRLYLSVPIKSVYLFDNQGRRIQTKKQRIKSN